ncbi:hypothetical protein L2E65_14220 [Planktothrix agardhii 1801]|jgi:hypothetical protein|uniref:hypothetical protein n=1 Tax=Planktothrix agardhii TaxID=1160 RepID=UPI001F1CA87D|nr:hypothetical protein [Planktothrix agardhii]MCF3625943.1 hypothetical protein [Planktothrix agardhii 1801]
MAQSLLKLPNFPKEQSVEVIIILEDNSQTWIDWNGVSYRLVYRIYENLSPKRVVLLSFAEHDPAYEKAQNRK